MPEGSVGQPGAQLSPGPAPGGTTGGPAPSGTQAAGGAGAPVPQGGTTGQPGGETLDQVAQGRSYFQTESQKAKERVAQLEAELAGLRQGGAGADDLGGLGADFGDIGAEPEPGAAQDGAAAQAPADPMHQFLSQPRVAEWNTYLNQMQERYGFVGLQMGIREMRRLEPELAGQVFGQEGAGPATPVNPRQLQTLIDQRVARIIQTLDQNTAKFAQALQRAEDEYGREFLDGEVTASNGAKIRRRDLVATLARDSGDLDVDSLLLRADRAGVLTRLREKVRAQVLEEVSQGQLSGQLGVGPFSSEPPQAPAPDGPATRQAKVLGLPMERRTQ